jgi:hypothetical protein
MWLSEIAVLRRAVERTFGVIASYQAAVRVATSGMLGTTIRQVAVFAMPHGGLSFAWVEPVRSDDGATVVVMEEAEGIDSPAAAVRSVLSWFTTP